MNESTQSIPVKVLIIGNVKKGNSILLRKKFAGSKPYAETWYSFGTEFIPGKNASETFTDFLRGYVGISVSLVRSLSWDAEIKEDHDGVLKQFIYVEAEFEYVSGDLIVPDGLEKVEWVAIEKLTSLDIVPPSVSLFKRLGYLKYS